MLQCSQFGLSRCCACWKAIIVYMFWKHVSINSKRQIVPCAPVSTSPAALRSVADAALADMHKRFLAG